MRIDNKKIEKLIHHLKTMLVNLQHHRLDADIHHSIDQFYYIEKETELKVLHEELEKALDRVRDVQEIIEVKYREAYCNWRKDVRWMNIYLVRKSALSDN